MVDDRFDPSGRPAISIARIVETMAMLMDQWEAHLHPESGEIVFLTEEDRFMLEREIDEDDLPEWQREALPKMREAAESEEWLALPDKIEIHDWAIMERFCHRVPEEHQGELLDAIHGRGAFRLFRDHIQRLGLEKDWFAFKDSEYERIAREWLEAHGLAYH